ncbi:hypothetical protein C0J52_19523 [Blattella germanica]|nr:hypothetical protein C0J52_19523 [Blattella germanica]
MEAKADHALLKTYKNNADDSVVAIAVDLQQAMPTPRLTSGIQYYKRKMWTCNLGIHNIKTGCAAMYV